MRFSPGELVQVIRKTNCPCRICERVFVGMPGTIVYACLVCTVIYGEIAYHVDIGIGQPALPESHLKKIDDPDADEKVEREASAPRETA